MEHPVYNTIATCDIETTLIDKEVGITGITKIFCNGVKINDQPTKSYTYKLFPGSSGNLRGSLKAINNADAVLGHNFYGFDAPVIQNCIGPITVPIEDTLILSKLMFTKDQLLSMDFGIAGMPKDLWGKYSLKAFGYRLGSHKIEFEQFDELTSEMITYMEQDVDLTYKLYTFLRSQPNFPNREVIELEYETARIIQLQEQYGFYIDIDKARNLLVKMTMEQTGLITSLRNEFKPKYLPPAISDIKKNLEQCAIFDRIYNLHHKATDADTMHGYTIEACEENEVPMNVPANMGSKTKLFIEDTSYKFKSRPPYRLIHQLKRYKNGRTKLPGKKKYKWHTQPTRVVYNYRQGPAQKVEYTKFKATGSHIQLWLKTDLGFEFNTYTAKGSPKVNAESLEGIDHPSAKKMKRFLKLKKDLSQLESGDGSLIKNYRATTKTIPSRIDTNGTVTGRFTSSSINTSQIPAQPEFRELFSSPEGWTFIGTDFGGQENVNLAEALYPFDNGRLDKIIMSGDKDQGTDLHSLNAKSCAVSRSDAKPLWFGF